MRLISTLLVVIALHLAVAAQNERISKVEKEFEYENWTFKNVNGEGATELRQFATGKKLVMVVYFAAWCHNWRHEAPFVQSMYEKYRKDGFAVIGVAEYEALDKTREILKSLGITFPVVYESTTLADRLTTSHYKYRTQAGDTRKWGSPWHIFMHHSSVEPNGSIILRKAFVVNGELIEEEVEPFIRERLGLPKLGPYILRSMEER